MSRPLDFASGSVDYRNRVFSRLASQGNFRLNAPEVLHTSNPMKGAMRTLQRGAVLACVLFLSASNARAADWYVATSGSDAAAGTNWATAMATIQAAIDVAASNDTVWVSNGVYATGGRVVYGAMTNRVAITNAITVRSINGPGVTTIEGAWELVTTNGNSAVRCAYVGTNAVLSGFTLTHGATRQSGHFSFERSGGGAWCEVSGIISNCALTGNSASLGGGGVYHGKLNDCTLTGNSVKYSNNQEGFGGGAYDCTLSNCTLTGNSAQMGGGSYYGTLYNCTLFDNIVSGLYGSGGGAYGGILNNCIVRGNTGAGGAECVDMGYGWLAGIAGGGGGASHCTMYSCLIAQNTAALGGGTDFCTLYNCTVTENTAYGAYVYCEDGGHTYGGGGIYGGIALNCVVQFNTANTNANAQEASFSFSCVDPLPDYGEGNISSNPLFVSSATGNFRLQENSPCIENGSNHTWMAGAMDLEGNRRVSRAGQRVDMGAYEYVFPPAPELVVSTTGGVSLISGDDPSPANGTDFGVVPIGQSATNRFVATNAGAVALALAWATNGTAFRIQDAPSTLNPGQAAVFSVVFSPGAYLTYTGAVFVTHNASNVPSPYVLSLRGKGSFGTNAMTFYVVKDNLAAAAPYTNWTIAAADIQTAIDYALPGDTVMVSNGVYDAGGTTNYPTGSMLTNRVSIHQPILVRSMNGSSVTVIQGAKDLLTTNGNAAVRCVWMATGASLAGFTLTNGATAADGSSGYGGGVWCQSSNAVVSNCVLTGNSAYSGGGASSGTLYSCTFIGNAATNGGGSSYCTLYNCTLWGNSAFWPGGGAYYGALYDCSLSSNSAGTGGGAYYSTLYNCMLSGNSAAYGGATRGGTLYSCRLSGNSASYGGGGGVYGGTLYNCAISDNSSDNKGGGACGNSGSSCILNNCTLAGNSAVYGGGVYDDDFASVQLNNCIVYYNTAEYGENYGSDSSQGVVFNFSCTTPAPSIGTSNITSEPLLLSASHIASNSACVGIGSTNYSRGTDLDGEPWRTPPAMGCDEPNRPATGGLNAAIFSGETNVVSNYPWQFRADIQGIPVSNLWTFGDGGVLANQFLVEHSWASTGLYALVLQAWNDSNPGGVSVTVMVHIIGGIHYVNVSNLMPALPYVSWETAATNIQDAVDVAPFGGLVLVSNGVYGAGGRSATGSALTNRLAIHKPITVLSVNGPAFTIIQGAKDPLTTNGNAAVRCVYMSKGASLSGFSITNGATRNSGEWYDFIGGGVRCGSTNETISNCVITGNSATFGGGAYQGTLNNCTLSGNSAFDGGGSCIGTLNNCTLSGNSASFGGGAYGSTLNNCTLTGNSAFDGGGGSGDGTLNNCTLAGNSASTNGGGAFAGTLNNCTLTGNSASQNGGGSYYGTLNNCIVYYNTALDGANYNSSTFSYSCTTPAPSGIGNITNDPQFVNAAIGDNRLSTNSPCIDKGDNASVLETTDLDGNPRIVNGLVDMGAYESQVLRGYWDWASEITNGLTNYNDCATGDGFPNLLKYATGGSPTDSDDLPRLDCTKSNGVPVLIFHRNTNAGDATLIVQGAFAISNGALWSGLATNRNGSWGGANNVSESGAGNPVTCRVLDTTPMPTNRFLRLKVTRP